LAFVPHPNLPELVQDWQVAGLLKPSVITTLERALLVKTGQR